MKLPFTDLKLLYELDKNEYIKVITECLENSAFILGAHITEFEKEISAFLDAKYSIAVSSGTDALYIPLLNLGIGRDDEVITTPFTFIATAEVISLLGAKPIFVDIDYDTFNIDAAKIEEKITPKTKAIIPVHLYGHPAEMEKILEIAKKYNLFVIEDACQAIGAKYKDKFVCNFGDCGALSFFPSKNLGAFGDAGMIITNSSDLMRKYLMIRVHGQEKRYIHEVLGINGRLDNIQAAILRIRLRRLNAWIEDRIKCAAIYNTELANISGLSTPITKTHCRHVFNQYTIRIKQNKRDEFAKLLEADGIPTAVHYPLPLHLQPAFKYLDYKKGDLPVSEQAAAEVISLPIFPGMTDNQQSMVIDAIKTAAAKLSL